MLCVSTVRILWFLILTWFLTYEGIACNELLIEVSGKEVYIAWPDRSDGGTAELPVLMAIHGSGREAGSYMPGHKRENPFYVHQRDLALENGYLFTVVSNGQDTWGTDAGLQSLISVYEYIENKFPVKNKWVLWGSSAGGVLMHRMLKEHPDKVEKMIGTFPVYDLQESYHRIESARKAWKDPDSMDKVNPLHYPAFLVSVPILLFHGRHDEAVPVACHSRKLYDEVNNLGGNVRLILVPGGHSTENFKLYRDQIIRKFLRF